MEYFLPPPKEIQNYGFLFPSGTKKTARFFGLDRYKFSVAFRCSSIYVYGCSIFIPNVVGFLLLDFSFFPLGKNFYIVDILHKTIKSIFDKYWYRIFLNLNLCWTSGTISHRCFDQFRKEVIKSSNNGFENSKKFNLTKWIWPVYWRYLKYVIVNP